MVTYHLPGGEVVKESARQFRRHKRHGFDPLIGKTPHGAGQPSPYSVTTEPMHPSACTLQQEKPGQREARVPAGRE